jgi:hypothetical protein
MPMRPTRPPVLIRRRPRGAPRWRASRPGAAALGAAELIAGILPGAASPVIAVGDAVIALQPPGAKQFVVDLFGEADKLVLTVVIARVALGVAAGLGVLARDRPGWRASASRSSASYLGAGLRDPLAEPLPTLVVRRGVAVALGIACWAGCWAWRGCVAGPAEMPAWGDAGSSAHRWRSSAWRSAAVCRPDAARARPAGAVPQVGEDPAAGRPPRRRCRPAGARSTWRRSRPS